MYVFFYSPCSHLLREFISLLRTAIYIKWWFCSLLLNTFVFDSLYLSLLHLLFYRFKMATPSNVKKTRSQSKSAVAISSSSRKASAPPSEMYVATGALIFTILTYLLMLVLWIQPSTKGTLLYFWRSLFESFISYSKNSWHICLSLMLFMLLFPLIPFKAVIRFKYVPLGRRWRRNTGLCWVMFKFIFIVSDFLII